VSEGTITSPRKLTPAEIEQMRREWEAQYVGYSDAQGRVSYAADEPWLGISSAKVRQRIAGIEGELTGSYETTSKNLCRLVRSVLTEAEVAVDGLGRLSPQVDEPWLGINAAKVRQRIAGLEGEQEA